MLLNRPTPLSLTLRNIKHKAGAVLHLLIWVLPSGIIWDLKFRLSPSIPALMCVWISILLAFSTNQAYERWREVRA